MFYDGMIWHYKKLYTNFDDSPFINAKTSISDLRIVVICPCLMSRAKRSQVLKDYHCIWIMEYIPIIYNIYIYIYIYPHSTSILVAFILVNWVNHHRITFFQYPIQSPVCLVKSPTSGPMHPHVFWLNPHYILVVTPTEECVATVTPDRDEFFANDNDLICRITLGT